MDRQRMDQRQRRKKALCNHDQMINKSNLSKIKSTVYILAPLFSGLKKLF